MPETTQIGGYDGGGNKGAASQDNTNSALTPNTVLLRRYKILGILGSGGMGAVYKARDLNFPDVQRYAAVKEMHTPSSDRNLRDQTLATFRREANILATLNHPAIPKIFDFFDLNNRAYLVMEYIHGRDLEALLQQTRKLPVDKVIEWAVDLCEVLSYLHSQEPDPIIFRDIKLSNIMIDSLGKVRLIDFGIAKTFVSGKKHTMIGTEGYSAPEQYKGNVSPLSDQYSLGATLHHILTRRDPRIEQPFSFHERPITEANPEVPRWFEEIINRALSFQPSERFESCTAMGEAIKMGMTRGAALNLGAIPQSEGGGTKIISENQPKWIFKTEDEVRSSPTVHDNMVFVGSYDTNVWALNLENGELIWKFPTQGGIAASPVVDGSSGLVLFGSEDRTFNAVNYRTGRIVWSFTTKDRIRSTPSLAMDHVFFGSDDGKLHALVAANGRNLWSYDAGAAIRTRPLVTDDLVIFGCDTGEITAVTLSGDRKWASRAKRSVESSPVLNAEEGIVYAGSHDGFMYAFEAGSGYNSWRFRTSGPIISTPVIYDNLLIFGSADKSLYAIDTYSSREKWRFNTEQPIVSSPVIHNDKVYFGGIDKRLYCLDAKTGKEVWKFEAEREIISTPCIVGDMIIFGSIDHKVYALPILD